MRFFSAAAACLALAGATSPSRSAAPVILEPGVLGSLSVKSLKELLALGSASCPKCKSKQDYIGAVM